MDDQVSKVPSQMPPRPTIEFPSLASVGAAVMLGIHPTFSGVSLANGLATEKEPHKAGKHPLQNHVPTSPKCAQLMPPLRNQVDDTGGSNLMSNLP
jgi:hypothetical protein